MALLLTILYVVVGIPLAFLAAAAIGSGFLYIFTLVAGSAPSGVKLLALGGGAFVVVLILFLFFDRIPQPHLYLRKYGPMNDELQGEFEQWRRGR